jgi:AAA domain
MSTLSVPEPNDAWALGRLLTGKAVDVSIVQDKAWSRIASWLHPLKRNERHKTWTALQCRFEDNDATMAAIWGAEPLRDSPPLTIKSTATSSPPSTLTSTTWGRAASLASVRRDMIANQWHWNGYIPSARIAGIAASEGCGKTRFAMDLARRIWHGLPWPDGSPPTFPTHTPTLWSCSDGQQVDLAAMAAELSLPDEAIYLNTDEANPYDGGGIDDDDDRTRLERYILELKPALVFIDTLTNATSFNMCSAHETKLLMTSLTQLAQRTQTTIIPLLHLSKEGQALGRRIKGLTRTLIHLECPDRAQPSRLRLWVEKSFAKKPPALGVRMTDTGNEYDSVPPAFVSTPGDDGEHSASLSPSTQERAMRFVLDSLSLCNDQCATDLAMQWVASGGNRAAFYRAVDALAAEGSIDKIGGGSRGKPIQLHLFIPAEATD